MEASIDTKEALNPDIIKQVIPLTDEANYMATSTYWEGYLTRLTMYLNDPDRAVRRKHGQEFQHALYRGDIYDIMVRAVKASYTVAVQQGLADLVDDQKHTDAAYVDHLPVKEYAWRHFCVPGKVGGPSTLTKDVLSTKAPQLPDDTTWDKVLKTIESWPQDRHLCTIVLSAPGQPDMPVCNYRLKLGTICYAETTFEPRTKWEPWLRQYYATHQSWTKLTVKWLCEDRDCKTLQHIRVDMGSSIADDLFQSKSSCVTGIPEREPPEWLDKWCESREPPRIPVPANHPPSPSSASGLLVETPTENNKKRKI